MKTNISNKYATEIDKIILHIKQITFNVKNKITLNLSLHKNVTFLYHLPIVFVLPFILLFICLFSSNSSSFCSSHSQVPYTGINGRNLRIPFISQTSIKVGTKRFCYRLNFAGGRGSWPRPLSLQIALNRVNVVTYWWIRAAIAWKKKLSHLAAEIIWLE